jgi:protein SCO1/2
MRPYWTLTLAGCLLVGAAIVVGCSGGSAKKEREYPIRGTVVEVGKDRIKIDHEAIPGYMGAMTMSFPVSKPDLVQGLKAGDLVRGRLSVGDGEPVISQLNKE